MLWWPNGYQKAFIMPKIDILDFLFNYFKKKIKKVKQN